MEGNVQKAFNNILLLITLWGIPHLCYSSVAYIHYGTEEGLSESHIISITQDSTGFIWLAGENSLIRFDGHQFKPYKNRSGGHTVLPANKLTTLYTDSAGVLWTGSEKGLFFYDPLNDKFRGLFKGLEHTLVTDIKQDQTGHLLLATDEGLAVFDRNSHTFEWIRSKDFNGGDAPKILPSNSIKKISMQPDGKIWLAMFPNGLCRLDLTTLEVEEFSTIENVNVNELAISSIEYFAGRLFIGTLSEGFFALNAKEQKIENFIFENLTYDVQHFDIARDSTLWLATSSGLIQYNYETEAYRRYTNIEGDPLSIDRTAVIHVYIDRDNNLWTSSGIRGVNYGLNNTPFEHFMFYQNLPYTLTHKEVTSISMDTEGNLWLGYEAGIVEKHNPHKLTRERFLVETKSLSGYAGAIFCLFEDREKQFWLGGWECGLQKFNSQTNTFQAIQFENDALSKLFEKADIRHITEDVHGNLWISLHGKGIIKYNPKTDRSERYQFDEANPENSLSNDYAFDMCFSDANNLWIATAHGVSRLNISDRTFKNYYHNDQSERSLSSNTVNTVYLDKSGLIWAGTNNGLNVYLAESDSFFPIKIKNDFTFHDIASIEAVKPGEIWVSTESGILKLTYSWSNDPKFNYYIEYFNRSDGLISTNYFDRSSTSTMDSTIFFGGNEGIDYFNAYNASRQSNRSTKVIITETSIYGQPVFPQYEDSNDSIRTLKLEHDEKMLSLRFTSLNFANPATPKYRYKLNGFDKQWIVPQNEQVATYTSLLPGNYLFEVQTTDFRGEWSNQSEKIQLVVKPPFWLTIPFVAFAILLGISLIILFHRIRNRTLIRRQHELEMTIKERTIELQAKNLELEKANLTKNKFFTIISHDLKSPFSGLLGILEILKEQVNLEQDRQKQLLKVAYRSAENTFNLLENLLIWASSQSEKLRYYPSHHNLSKLIQSNIVLNKEKAQQKGIQIKADFPKDLNAYIDPDMLNTVVRNILSNAIKFTNPGGEIIITAEKTREEIVVNIADNGIGMSKEQQLQLFKVGKTNREGTAGEQGTGLGLVICQEFMHKNHGKIRVSSNHPKGTVFHFNVPQNKPVSVE